MSDMLWSDDKIQALIQQNNDDYGTSSVLDDALWQMRGEYEAALEQERSNSEANRLAKVEQAALAAQAARTIESLTTALDRCAVDRAWRDTKEQMMLDRESEYQRTIEAQAQRIAELEAQLAEMTKPVELWT